MATDFKLPDLGENITTADIIKVLVSEGDTVEKEQGVVEVETDKATVEVPCSVAGKVTKVHVSDGDTVEVGQVLISLDSDEAQSESKDEPKPKKKAAKADEQEDHPEEDEEPAAESKSEEEEEVQEQDQPQEDGEAQEEDGQPRESEPAKHAKAPARSTPRPAPAEAKTTGDVAPASPTIRRLARELGIDLQTVAGSGDGGRITREDVIAAVRARGDAPAPSDQPSSIAPGPVTPPGKPDNDSWGPITRERMPKIRRTIAKHMTDSFTTIPHVTNFDDADVTELEAIRKASKVDYERSGIKLTSMPFIVKACALALRHHPVINAAVDMDAGEAIYKQYVNIGVAVDTDRGLIVPVLRSVDQMSFADVARGLMNAAQAARTNNFAIEDLRGGTFTISNLGAIGGTYSTPIINKPEVAILLVGRSRKLPVVTDAGTIEPRLIMPLSLSYDHRIVDGSAAARFLNEVIDLLESPGRLLLAP
jgi:pyruvate/2-oxoglutarate dehydrogenase complex dihydrolipoamide acyltransferase (E2) component